MTTFDVVEPSPERGQVLHQRMAELYPICRSITGDGVRQTLQLIGREIPLEVKIGEVRHPGLRLDHQ